MRSDQRIVVNLPLKELWNHRGPVAAARVSSLSEEDIRELLRAGPVRFVVANVGDVPEWVAEAECFAHWHKRFVGHLAVPGQPVSLDDFPGGYCYFASRWSETSKNPIVVLERCH